MTLLELLHLLRKHLKLVIALPIVFAIACGVVTLFMPNQYTASTTMYVLSKNADYKSGNAYSDLNAGSPVPSRCLIMPPPTAPTTS